MRLRLAFALLPLLVACTPASNGGATADVDADDRSDADDDAPDGDNPPAGLRLVRALLPVARPGAAYTARPAVTGAVGTARVALVRGSLPAGIALTPDGTLEGAVAADAADGLYPFVAEVTDDAGGRYREVFAVKVGTSATWLAKTREYERIYLLRHSWNGLSLDAMKPDAPDGKIDLVTFGDSSFLHGNNLSGAAYRFAAEGTADARAMVTRMVEGMTNLHDISGKPGLMVRGYIRDDQPWAPWEIPDVDTPGSDHYRGTGRYTGWRFISDSSRDQYMGAIMGLALANELVDDAAVKAETARILGLVADHVWDNGLQIVDMDGARTQYGELDGFRLEGFPAPNGLNAVCLLAWLKAAAVATGEPRHEARYRELLFERNYWEPLEKGMWVWQNTYNSKFYNVYMAAEGFFTVVRLERDPDIRARLAEAFRTTMWAPKNDTRRGRRLNVMANANMTPWYVFSTGAHEPDALYDVLLQLRDFPAPPLRDAPVRNSLNPAVAKNPEFPEWADAPLPSNLRAPDMVRWHRNPYILDGGFDAEGRERTGADWLYPYWMGRYYGYVSADW